MSVLNILHYPDPRLRERAKPVEEIDGSMREIIKDMFETMYKAPGIGLAAVQVGLPVQLAVIDVSDEKNEPRVFINPEIVHRAGDVKSEEGCLSVPGYYDVITRSEQVAVKALDEHGNSFQLEADGLLAICIQHEIDHLNGRLFIDRLSDLKRRRVRRQMNRAHREERKTQG